MAPDFASCPECGRPLNLTQRRVGALAVCPWCAKPVRLRPLPQPPPSRPRATARPEALSGAPRPAPLTWTVFAADGQKSPPLNKADLDLLAKSGGLDGRARVKRQDWADARTAAELYQGLAVSVSEHPAKRTSSPFAEAGRGVPPWSPPVRTVSGWRWAKIAAMILIAVLGMFAFGRSLGGPMLQPVFPRRLLFWLFAIYWLGLASFAAGWFDWRWRTEAGELGGLHRLLGERAARWALLCGGGTLMLAIVWLIW